MTVTTPIGRADGFYHGTMSRIVHKPAGQGRTIIVHEPTGSEISTDVSPEFGGGGSTFSSTDLVAAGLGSCISSSLEVLAARRGIPLEAISIEVVKELATEPKRISRLAVTIALAVPFDEKVAALFERAAHTCTVHRSLHPDIDAPIEVIFTA